MTSHSTVGPLLGDVTSPGRSVRAFIEAAIESEVEAGGIFWNRDCVVDSPMPLGHLPAKVRFVPTFAHRQLLYDGPPRAAAGCRLCAVIDEPRGLLDVTGEAWPPGTVPSWWALFESLFVLRHNNFPYFDRQFMLAAREHAPLFGEEHLRTMLHFAAELELGAGAMQVAGSGATIADHAHISFFDEPVPLFALPRRPLARGSVVLEAAEGHPGAVFVVPARGTVDARARFLHRAIGAVSRAGYSHNLFIERGGALFLVPRRAELAPSIERKVGSVEIAGVYLGNALGSETTDLAALEEIIRARCAAVSATRYEAALAEAGCAGRDADAVRDLLVALVRDEAGVSRAR